ncbi:CotO family spore coat protein [Aquibacillus sediminis]|uniref:CotO family spore coat protein n=1 Tax=Aquibacillus sediminis TaxID=2574734 RepID=UPI00110930AF|nr:CotO family spore coat protein [Aquibacillus sediminis]
MRKRRKYTQRPMLYIEQPKLGNPSASMQSKYRTPKKKEPTVEQRKAQKAVRNKSKFLQDMKQEAKQSADRSESIEQYVDEEETNDTKENENVYSGEKQTLRRKRTERKKFKDMTIEEKVEYFVGLPSQVPRMKCEVVTTEEEKLRGVIADYQDGIVQMATYKYPRLRELNIDEIESIRLLSF